MWLAGVIIFARAVFFGILKFSVFGLSPIASMFPTFSDHLRSSSMLSDVRWRYLMLSNLISHTFSDLFRSSLIFSNSFAVPWCSLMFSDVTRKKRFFSAAACRAALKLAGDLLLKSSRELTKARYLWTRLSCVTASFLYRLRFASMSIR